jgi:hypothetical protein
MTAKHQKNENGNKMETKMETLETLETQNMHCCSCGKKYESRSGLWKHAKLCEKSIVYETIDISNDNAFSKIGKNRQNSTHDSSSPVAKLDMNIVTKVLLESMKDNQEFKKIIVEQNEKIFEQNEKLIDFAKQNGGSNNITTNTNTNSNNNNNNNTNNNFNLNFFLNETCKDAMNIKEFIDSLQVHFKDLEYNGENGYAAGISNIFLRELKQLDICKRPIHCSDLKREVFHIKNEDGWEKERELLIKCIKQITRKNVILLADWRTANPGCMDLYHKKNNQYNKINCETLGPYLDDEEEKCFNKIISSVAKATVIQKK